MLAEEISVDIGKLSEVFIEIFLTSFGRGVEDIKKTGECGAKIGTVVFGVIFNIKFKRVRRENSSVLGEKAEENANEKSAEFMAFVAAVVKGVMKLAHEGGGLFVGRVFGVEFMLFITSDEGEVAGMIVEFREGNFHKRIGTSVVEKREVALVVGFKVVETDADKIGDDDVARDFIVAAFVGEGADVGECLGSGLAEVLTGGFVLDDEGAGPDEVNETVIAREIADGFLIGGDAAAGDAENQEEFVPEGLAFGFLAGGGAPFVGEADGALLDFIPREKHSGKVVTGRGGMARRQG
ncbi:MAG: hypothetical protein LBC18_11930 [Opitutaceae bacterium]|jgi:hypothetical protein|nr:hypothetical protein [Opitutaceae bacterium]